MRLVVDTISSLVDETPVVRVSEVTAGAAVDLLVELTDAAGNPWRSSHVLHADEFGNADSTTLDDASAPWWDMAFLDESKAPTGFVASDDVLTAVVTATAGDEHSSSTVERRWRADGVTTDAIDGDGFRCVVFIPVGGSPAPGVLIVPGSTGVAAVTPMAALLASHGFAAAVVGYMEDEGLPPSLAEIPIEVIARAADGVTRHVAFSDDDLAVICLSVGTQGALAALAELEMTARATVAISPSSVIWQALGDGGPPPKTSAWTRAGEVMPWVPIHGDKLLGELVKHKLFDRFSRHPKPAAMHMLPAFAAGFADSDAVAEASIAVEKIAGPLMLIAGGCDEMWPSTTMADAIAARRTGAGVGADDRTLRFDNAGHFFRPPVIPTTVGWNDALVSGGDPSANAAAQAQGWEAILDFVAV